MRHRYERELAELRDRDKEREAEKNKPKRRGRPPSEWTDGRTMINVGLRLPEGVWVEYKMRCLKERVTCPEQLCNLIENYLSS